MVHFEVAESKVGIADAPNEIRLLPSEVAFEGGAWLLNRLGARKSLSELSSNLLDRANLIRMHFVHFSKSFVPKCSGNEKAGTAAAFFF